jgi:hypothetical protein
MIDNLQTMLNLLVFRSEDDFYHLQIIKRKKEHPELDSNSYVVKSYYINSTQYLLDKWNEIVTLCAHHNARACINLNRRSFEKCAFQLLRKVSDQILNKDYRSCRKAYESVCGTYSNEPDKKWIIAVDTHDATVGMVIVKHIRGLMPEPGTSKLVATIPTKNDYHIITRPFDIAEFRKVFPNIEIHKDNPTILYIP